MTVTGLFAHRSGRVISLSRLLLAASFTALIWVDPSQPRGPHAFTFVVLGSYIAWSVLVLAVTWSSWRWDNRLANTAHVVDVAMFGVLVSLTEGYSSPYFAFFVFLLLSSSIRWSWRETALTALAIMILFATAGAVASTLGTSIGDPFQLAMRCLYLVILSVLFIWFGVNQAEGGLATVAGAGLELQPGEPPGTAMLAAAAERFGARRLVLAWSQREEPWLEVTIWDQGETRRDRFAPDHFGKLLSDKAQGRAFLFDVRRGVGLRRREDDPHRFVEFDQVIAPGFAEHAGLRSGLAVRILAENGKGELFITGTPSLCSDDITIAERLGFDLSAMVDRSAAVAYSEEEAVRRAKTSLARDLHDGVIQSLTGASLKLAAMRAGLDQGEDVRDELDLLRQELSGEQRNIRTFTESLRSGRGPARKVDLSSGLPYIAEELSQRWDLVCALKEMPAVEGPVWMEHDLHQMVREAAANAVRHGRATVIEIAMGSELGGIELCITDNGTGYVQPKNKAANGEGPLDAPRSLRERAEGLGGRIEIEPTPGQCRTLIWVPLHESS